MQELQQIVYRLEGENENLLQRERKILKTARQSEYKYLEKEEVASNAHQKAERMQTENESLHAEIESLRVLAQELEHSNRELKRSNVAQHQLFEEESKTSLRAFMEGMDQITEEVRELEEGNASNPRSRAVLQQREKRRRMRQERKKK